MYIFALLVLLNLNVFSALTGTSDLSSISGPLITKPLSQIPYIPTNPDEETLKEFWELHMKPVFEDKIFKLDYPIKEINDRCKFLMAKIYMDNHTILDVKRTLVFFPSNNWVYESGDIVNNIPTIHFFAPALYNVHEVLIRNNGKDAGEKIFQLTVVVAFINQLDHLAYGYAYNGKRLKTEELIECERQAWALTCKYTLAPLVKNGQKIYLGETEQRFYDAWVNASENVDSKEWKDFIKNLYIKTMPAR